MTGRDAVCSCPSRSSSICEVQPWLRSDLLLPAGVWWLQGARIAIGFVVIASFPLNHHPARGAFKVSGVHMRQLPLPQSTADLLNWETVLRSMQEAAIL